MSLQKLKESVFAYGRPEPYITIAPDWQAAGTKQMSKISNSELAEYLMGIEADIKCPQSFWPKDKPNSVAGRSDALNTMPMGERKVDTDSRYF